MTSSNKMYRAISRDDADAVRALVAEDPTILSSYFLRDSWLHRAAQLGRVEIMDVLVNAGIPVDQLTNDEQETPLHSAAGQGHHNSCEWLLNHGADVDHGVGKQATPIFSAVFSKSLPLVELFVSRGADLDATFGDPQIDLISYAQRHGTPEIVAFLQGRLNRG